MHKRKQRTQGILPTTQLYLRPITLAKGLRSVSHLLLFVACFICTSSLSLKAKPRINLGIDVLESKQFQPLIGKRVGLLTHPAGVNKNGVSTIRVLHRNPNVDLVALYGPEHGIYGDEKANVKVDNRIDKRTGLPVFSLYGDTRKPTPKMLDGIDIMVIDLQDLGVRSYTYVSCMKRTIEACFENGVDVMVLDRPNPLGGLKVDGPPLDKHLMSYVGDYQVPYVHGLTIAELANMAKRVPGWLDIEDITRRKGKLYLVPMQGWARHMMWPDTGLNWIPTSPAIPNLSAALGYAMTGLGTQLGKFSHGYGTDYPFRLLTYPGKTGEQIAQAMDSHNIPGLEFQPLKYKKRNGRIGEGAFVLVKNWQRLRPTEISFHMMRLADQWDKSGNPFTAASENQQLLYNKHVGSQDWWIEISSRGREARVEMFLLEWEKRAQRFQEQSKHHWLYK